MDGGQRKSALCGGTQYGRTGRRGRGFQMPRRQYMGDAEELRQKIIARLKAYMQSRIK